MAIRVKKQSNGHTFRAQVEKRAEADLSACYQCKKCSIGCPVSALVSAAPAEIIRRLQLGAGEELLKSDLIWLCLSCDTCYARCPNQVNFPAIIDALRALAIEKGVAKPAGKAPLFNKVFLNSVKQYGRAFDLQMIASYKLGSGRLMGDVGKFPGMLAKGKMAVTPPSGADKKTVKKIFKGLKK
ncbi:MAG TPA: 4Fe-4S dicluster domain-containing protein [Dehalococcoidales bacterium]|nr:4Fe-4S dicluster domain-containing protein [Dehalococcoidales bacterium]